MGSGLVLKHEHLCLSNSGSLECLIASPDPKAPFRNVSRSPRQGRLLCARLCE